MRAVAILLAGLAVTACGRSPETVGEATSSVTDPRLERGEVLSLACQACHTFRQGGKHLVGPNLYGVFGRPAATADGFDAYSEALRRSGIVWSPGVLDRWLEDPSGFLPGTTMGFTGYRAPEDRSALIDYLLVATGADDAD